MKSSLSATCSNSARASSTRGTPSSFCISSSIDAAHVVAREAAVAQPLPDLRAGDLGRRGVLHEVEDRRRADTVQPRRDVLDADADVLAQARLGDVAGCGADVEQRRRVGLDVLAQDVELVLALEALERDRNEIRVRDPRAVESLARLALLVLAHLRERDLVHRCVASRRDERGHAADRVRAAPVARVHEQLGVRAHERHRHRHVDAVGEHELLAVAELLDHAEDVVPAAGVEARRVLAQLVEDLVHLERGEDRLDQDGRADRAAAEPELVLGE